VSGLKYSIRIDLDRMAYDSAERLKEFGGFSVYLIDSYTETYYSFDEARGILNAFGNGSNFIYRAFLETKDKDVVISLIELLDEDPYVLSFSYSRSSI
jgi:hypothetical protein